MNAANLDPRSLSTLLEIMKALRMPGSGCPWDLEQTFATIAPYTIEEAYEVADAISKQDLEGLREELGDLLFQVVYHSQMAAEIEAFAFDDVVEAICRKMVRRHPHVFGEERARSPALAKGFWEDMKEREKAGAPDPGSALQGVPLALPALTRAHKLQKKAARVGFDWPSVDGVIDKIAEECQELAQACETGDKAREQGELGDLLFAVVNLARRLDIDPEAALRETNAKFERRFSYIEQQLRASGRLPEQASLDEMEGLWQAAKTAERA